MGSLNTGAIGSSPSVTWYITWTDGGSTFNITCYRGSDGQFYGGGWTAYIGFEDSSGPLTYSSTYISAPTYSNTTSTGSITLSPPASANIVSFWALSEDFTSSGVINPVNRKQAAYVNTVSVTVEDRIGSSSGTLLGSGTYSVSYGSTTRASSLRSTTYTGYSYSSDSGSRTITSATTLYRYFTANSYNIYYYKNDSNGTVANMPSNGTIAYGSSISSLRPTNTYTVTFNANGGTCSTPSLSSTRTFSSWNTAANGTGTSWSPGATFRQTSALSLYAQWGSASAITLPTPTRTGYDFLGWAESTSASSGSTGSYTPTGSITLYAIWKAKGIVHLYVGGAYHSYLVWIYTGDGAGPNSNGWHHAMPKIYCTSGNSTKYHTCG